MPEKDISSHPVICSYVPQSKHRFTSTRNFPCYFHKLCCCYSTIPYESNMENSHLIYNLYRQLSDGSFTVIGDDFMCFLVVSLKWSFVRGGITVFHLINAPGAETQNEAWSLSGLNESSWINPQIL